MSEETYNERIYRLSRLSTTRPRCKGCKAEVLWMQTSRGKKIPVDPNFITVRESVSKLSLLDKYGIIHRAPKEGTSGWAVHWQSCPNAADFHKNQAAG